MDTKIFFYKFLRTLNKQGMSTINVDELEAKKDLIIELLNSYRFNNYAKSLSSIKNFRLFICIIFLDFEMGIYDKENDALLFSDENGINQYVFDNILLDINDNLISELAKLIKLDINHKRQLKIN